MSCPSEPTYAAWLDDELPLAERRPVEAHLVGCQTCRALVLALRDESDLLGDVLHDREPPALPRHEAAAPARGLALGFVPAAAMVTMVLAGIGWALENLPSSIDWMNPFQFKGATEMLFKVIFVLRDEAPGVLGLGVAVAATAGLSALLTFAVTAVSRRVAGPGALVLAALALVGAPAPSEAHFGLHQHEDFELAAGETHDGTLIVSGGTVNIDGLVTGDLLVLAERLSVRGEVHGNVFAMAETTDLAGLVSGSVHIGSDRAEISGTVEGDVYAGAENFEISRDGRVARNVLVWIADGVVEGEVGRDLYTLGRRMEVRGSVGRNIHARRIRLAILDGAQVGGDVQAWLRGGREIDVSPGAQIAGEIRTEEVPSPSRMLMSRYGEAAFYLVLVLQFVAAFLVGMLLHALAPGLFAGRLATAGDCFRAMGVGFLALVATPLVLLVAACTLVGIPLALMGLAVYCAALYCSAILVGALIGSALVRPSESGAQSFGLALLAGLAVVVVLAHLPFVGWPVHVVVLLAGLGLLIERGQVAWNARRLAA